MPNYAFAYHASDEADAIVDFDKAIRRALIRRVLAVAAVVAGASVLIFA